MFRGFLGKTAHLMARGALQPDGLRTFLHVIIDTVAVEDDLAPYIAEARDCGDSQEDSFNRLGIDRDTGRSVRRRTPICST